MIRILTDDDNLHLIERREVESIEDEVSGRIARTILILLSDSFRELLEIRSLKLRLEILLPGGFYLYVHMLRSIDNVLSSLDEIIGCIAPHLFVACGIRVKMITEA